MLKIYNTLTKQKEKFIPQNTPNVKMYTCGVTVYDDCHLGHGRSLYTFEVIKRYLEYKGFKVDFVRNITDVDDKIINKARTFAQENNLSLTKAFDEIRLKYIKSYHDDLNLLDIPRAEKEPLATGTIPHIINFIQGLIDKGYAYQKQGNVYFSIRRVESYGKLSGKKIDDLYTGVRIEADPLKDDPLDFALWKAKKEDEPFWESPFGQGRPGWHIECSAMVHSLLGDTIDLHGGGKDLVFPHHENEIVQSQSFTGKPFARYWIHHGLITIENQKMAKSLGNFYRIKDLLPKWHADVLKLFYLSAHYSTPLDFTLTKLEEFEKQRQRLLVIAQRVKDVNFSEITDLKIVQLKESFKAAMDDDFNFSLAKAVLFELSSIVADASSNAPILGQVKTLFKEINNIFCLSEFVENVDSLEGYVQTQISLRKKYKSEKKYTQADQIRDCLLKEGIILDDLKDGTTVWRLKG